MEIFYALLFLVATLGTPEENKNSDNNIEETTSNTGNQTNPFEWPMTK